MSVLTLPSKTASVRSSTKPVVSASGNRRLPMFGGLDVKEPKRFLEEAKLYFKKLYSSPFPYKLTLENFEPLYSLGEGGFGKVYLVKYNLFDKSYYAMKVMKKRVLYESKNVERALSEKRVLQSLNYPFCIRLEYCCQDKINLYYVLPFISGGELFHLLRKFGKFEEDTAKFYTAQVVLGLEYLHFCNLVYRDLKPENILLDHFGYLKISDFGFAKLLSTGSSAYTFCGTPEYIAPEVILGTPYTSAVDWWAVGVLSYELVHGKTPFHDKDHLSTYKRIVDRVYQIPNQFSSELKDFVRRLLESDKTKRMGNLKKGVEEVKQHRWLKNINWLDLLNRRVVPPYIPPSVGDFDTANFPNLKKVTGSVMKDASDSDNEFEHQDVFKDF